MTAAPEPYIPPKVWDHAVVGDGTVFMATSEIITRWQPGSRGPGWTWHDEALDLLTRDHEATARIAARVKAEGINFGSRYGAHVCLGSDGRVWDGHHRIVIARALGIERMIVEVA